jgi:transposase
LSFKTPQPVRLMFQDEARFGRISQCRRCWHKKPMRPLVKAMLTREYTYAYGAVSPVDGAFDSLILPYANTECMPLFLDEIAERYPDENLIMVIDGAAWHKAKALQLPDNLKFHYLSPYSPELNPQEHLWDELREKFFHNQAFESMDTLEAHLVEGLLSLENDPQRVHSISAWNWIINSANI